VFDAYTNGSNVNYGVNNASLVRVNIATGMANPGTGANIYAGQLRSDTMTVVNTHSTSSGDYAVQLRGSGNTLEKTHFEGYDWGLLIGGAASGVGPDNGYWTFNHTINMFNGYNKSTQPGLKGVVWIDDVHTNCFGIELNDLSINTMYQWAANTVYSVGQRRFISTSRLVMLECTAAGTSHATIEPVVGMVGDTVTDNGVTWQYVYTALVQDDINDIVIPGAGTGPIQLKQYKFGGTVNLDALSSLPRPVTTTFYDHLCAPNNALMGKILDGTTGQDLDRSFSAGGLAGIVQLRGTFGGAAEELRTISDPVHGAQVYFHCMDPIIFRHNSAGGTAALRVHNSTGADINAGRDTFWRVTYGDPRGSVSWTSPLSPATNVPSFDRWYLEQVA
jgi:hypothetical protein